MLDETLVVWGGENNDPPVYGKVFISVKPFDDDKLSNSEKEEIAAEILKNYRVVTIQPEFVDPDFVRLVPLVSVNYDSGRTIKSRSTIEAAVKAEVEAYGQDALGKHVSGFEHSDLVTRLVLVDTAIDNVLVSLEMYKEIAPTVGRLFSADVDFGNAISRNRSATIGNLYSTIFSFNGKANCSFSDDPSTGILWIVQNVGTGRVRQRAVGTVDYELGMVSIEKVTFQFLNQTPVRIYVTPRSLNVNSSRSRLLQIRSSDVVVIANDVSDVEV
jgi:hypothetical protein